MGWDYVGATGNNDIDGLLHGTRWTGLHLSYSFPSWAGSPGVTAFNAAQEAVVSRVLSMIGTFTNLTFTQANEFDGDLTFGLTAQDPGVWAYAYFPDGGGDSFYSNDGSLTDPHWGNQTTVVFMHEIGHALGLKHPFEADDGFPLLSAAHNNSYFTVMAYNRPGAPQSYMQCDIAALQCLYGANFGFNAGNTTYKWNPSTGRMTVNGVAGQQPESNQILLTVWDGGGTDTYDLSNYQTSVKIDLRPGEWSLLSSAQLSGSGAPGNVANAFQYNGDARSLIENAIGGSADDTLIGNAAANLLNGGAGADSMSGGLGNDTYQVDVAGDTVQELAGEGIDTVRSAIDFVLSANLENLVLLGSAANGTGNELANNLVGNAQANRLVAGGGDDILSGGSGNDILDGGAGLDIASYADATAAVTVKLAVTAAQNTGGGGSDTLSGIEGVIGSKYADSITGTSTANMLDGGAGADTMTGGGGDDTYAVDNAGDKIIEASGAGTDTVTSSIAYTLAAGLENLTLTGTTAIAGTGNDIRNVIVGNGGANLLKGLGGNDEIDGGAGADTMYGGAGDDTYYINASSDKAIETSAADGVDIVRSTASFTLGAYVENLVLSGSAAINGTGNALANTITGNASANVINGGAGADSMSGGAGNDTYYVDDAHDTIVEAASGGVDLVNSSIAFTLADSLENLTLTGSSAISGSGNAAANVLTGNAAGNSLYGLAGNDLLDGRGGSDTMYGGAGNDTYVVANAGDKVVETSSTDGVDLVQSAISFTLGDYVENLSLTGASGINGTGNGLANILTGNAAGNHLNGGAGADRLVGGQGNDVYQVDNAGDVVVENAGEGSDEIDSAISWHLADNLEILRLTGTGAINGTGNDADNELIGNAGNNVLDGGLGADLMRGGSGNDTYKLDNYNDQILEQAGGGSDTVVVGWSYTLADNLENLTLTADSTSGIGNVAANIIRGSAGTNYLTGGGGADTLIAGDGDDYFIITSAADVVTGERYYGGAGMDILQVQTGETVDLSGTSIYDVEQLTSYGTVLIRASQLDLLTSLGASRIDITTAGIVDLVGASISVSAFDLLTSGITLKLTGATSASTVVGSDGKDTVFAGAAGSNIDGGLGNDALTGGAGSDYLKGGLGTDVLSGGGGNDYLIIGSAADISGSETYVGGSGTDQLQVLTGELVDLTGVKINSDIEQLSAYGTVLLTAAELDRLSSVQASQVGIATAGLADLTGAAISVSTFALDVGGITLKLTGSTAWSTVIGSDGDDVVFAGAAGGTVDGGAGNDTLTGGAGSDYLKGGLGTDTLSGGGGNDYLIIASAADVAGVETYVGGSGTDQLQVQTGELVDLTAQKINSDVEQLSAYGTVKLTAAQLDRLSSVQASQVTIATAGVADLTGAAISVSTFALDVAGITLNLTGSTASSSVIGSAGRDVVYAGAVGGTIDGGAGNDALTGGAGNDYLKGGLGADSVSGGAGDDYLIIMSAADVSGSESYVGGAGTDMLQLQTSELVDLTAATINSDIEQLSSYGSVKLTAAQLDRFSYVQASQVSIGTAGVVDLTGATLYVSSFSLGVAGITLKLTGSASWSSVTGSAGADVVFAGAAGGMLDGAAGNDTLTGGAGSDSLKGGLGKDSLSGGAGDDNLIVSAAADVVAGETYVGGTGNDALQIQTGELVDLSGVTINSDIEQLSTYGTVRLSAAQLDSFSYLSASQLIVATAGTVTMAGVGGYVSSITLDVSGVTLSMSGYAGYISVTGSAGADNVTASDGGGTINAGDGNDTVVGGSAALTIDGGAGNDSLTGGAAGDYLKGGLGKDNVHGGGGDDYLIITAAADVVAGETYAGGSGADVLQIQTSELVDLSGVTINADVEQLTAYGVIKLSAGQLDSLSYLGASQVIVATAGSITMAGVGGYLSALTLGTSGVVLNMTGYSGYLNVTGSAGADNVTGSDGGGVVNAGDGDDTITGAAGVLTMTGGAGADQFCFSSALSGGIDSISDFSSADDTIVLDRSIFTALAGPGGLSAAAFYAGAAAHDLDDRIIYDNVGGYLYYDPDGSGSAQAVAFAYIGAGHTLSAADFIVG